MMIGSHGNLGYSKGLDAMGKEAIFFDRDGTLIRHIPYLTDPERLSLLPTVGVAMAKAKKAGFLTILATNQSAVSRGIISEKGLNKIHKKLCSLLEKEGAQLDGLFYCPHHPTHLCSCRKPKPGMILEAAKKFSIDLKNSFMIGDEEKDIEAGAAAGCKTVLVGSRSVSTSTISPDFCAITLLEAIDWILR